MTTPNRISTAPPQRPSLDAGALREQGLARIRRLAAETWTDHNVHDPGITLLEACTYAMTELGFRIQLDMADLLASGDPGPGEGDLPPAHRVLPSHPVTPDDLRRVLLDHPLVGDAWILPSAPAEVPFFAPAAGDSALTYTSGTPRISPSGLFEVLLSFADRELDGNTFSITVDAGGFEADLDLALPPWDEDAAAPFRDGATVDAVTLLDPGSPWRALDEPQSFFGTARVDVSGPGGPAATDLWILLRVASDLEQPAAQLPAILAAATAAVASPAALAVPYAARVRAAAQAMRRVRRYVTARRNLCEDPVRLSAARVQEVAVSARIDVTGGADLERLLADIFVAVDHELSPPVVFRTLDALQGRGIGIEDAFEGPLLRSGFLDGDELGSRARSPVLYTSDILRLIMQRRRPEGGDLVAQENPGGRDILAVTDLRLATFINNRPVAVDARDCLHLAETERYRPRLSPAKSRIVFVRDDVEVPYDRRRVTDLFSAAVEARRAGIRPEAPSHTVPPAATGERLPVGDYEPIQNDLPRLYGVGETGLPQSAPPERRSQALQLQGYLMFFEQMLADVTAQLSGIHRYFSGRADETATAFVRPLFDLPGIQELLVRFDGVDDWGTFVADGENPHVAALRRAAEGPDRFLDRRNRMLDHLLARLGEDAVALGQELHRWGRSQLGRLAVDPADLPARLDGRRRAVNARLVAAKAAFLADAPDLSTRRPQGLPHPFPWRPDLVRIDGAAGAFLWTLVLGGQDVLRAAEPAASAGEAELGAEEAVLLGAQPASYRVDSVPGGQLFFLTDGLRTLAQGTEALATVADAELAAAALSERLAGLLVEESTTPFERRVAHLTGLRIRQRRPLLVPTDRFFEIVDDGAPTSKTWRLRSEPGGGGDVLLSAVAPSTAAAEPEALALALAAIDGAADLGIDAWNYRLAPAPGNRFVAELVGEDGNAVARTPEVDSEEAGEAAIGRAAELLYRHYGAEGMHLVEHLLLRPRRGDEPFLTIPPELRGDNAPDPYGHRLTLVLPSGFARDFALDPATAPRVPQAPHRFRDLEFRRHLERRVRESCPAHLLPAVRWVDRALPGTPVAPASFDAFEVRYLAWLQTVLVPGVDLDTAADARSEMIESLEALGGT
ncbi:MAG: hypothetical protein AAGD06_09875 [Acidobacteriota bacterium]